MSSGVALRRWCPGRAAWLVALSLFFCFFFRLKLDTTQHAQVGRQQNLCNSGLTYILPAVLNGIVVVGLEFATG